VQGKADADAYRDAILMNALLAARTGDGPAAAAAEFDQAPASDARQAAGRLFVLSAMTAGLPHPVAQQLLQDLRIS
jgi:hypothetical protein